MDEPFKDGKPARDAVVLYLFSGYGKSGVEAFSELRERVASGADSTEVFRLQAERESWKLRGSDYKVAAITPLSITINNYETHVFYLELESNDRRIQTMHFVMESRDFLTAILERHEVKLFAVYSGERADFLNLALSARQPIKPLFALVDKKAMEMHVDEAVGEIASWRIVAETELDGVEFALWQAPWAKAQKDRHKMKIDSELGKLLHLLTVDCKDDRKRFIETKRLDIIGEQLEKSAYNVEKRNLSRIYEHKNLAKGEGIVIISSHADCVYNKLHSDEKDKKYIGTYDNSATNAAVVYLMEKGLLNENVVVAFTGDEEVGGGGAEEVAKRYIDSGRAVRCVIVCDLTNEGWKDESFFSIENDYASAGRNSPYSSLKSLKAKIRGVASKVVSDYPYVHGAEPDEALTYKEQGFAVFSLCLPCKGKMHAKKGVKIRKKALGNYALILAELANTL
jgi:hypothetical protein